MSNNLKFVSLPTLKNNPIIFMATKLKQQLLDILTDINIGKISSRYFGKSPSWIYHKFDGLDGNKKETDFTNEERKILRDGLYDLADRIRRAADGINIDGEQK